LPFIGAGSVLITSCDNGIDASIISSISYFSSEFKSLAEKLPAIRISWNGKAIKQSEQPIIKFEDKIINYPVDAFLQPSIAGEKTLRGLVRKYTAGSSKIVDLFSGLGNFTFAVNAIGYDINGLGSKRDLFKKPLKPTDLNKYDCVIMDPPRGGATAQCKELIKSNIHRIVYVSCSPDTFTKDKNILESGGFKLINLIPVDQFVGSDNWELVSLFTKD
jgi:23S rRNA (uracil1939-C5)-methyltransferase